MTSPLETICQQNPEYITKYQEEIPRYKILCEQVKQVIHENIHESKLPIASVSARVKTLSSFCEKTLRKGYKNPFEEMTDFSGIRIVYLYISDRVKIEKIIEQNFEIVEKIDKIKEDTEKFGYGALHYIIKLRTSNSRNKDLVCEIQVRTIVQDSWAIIAHHLAYKNELDIPTELRRQLNALSGLFEIADSQFETIKTKRNKYQKKVEKEIASESQIPLEQTINLDNLVAYLKWKFPDREQSELSRVSELLNQLKQTDITTLISLDKEIDRSLDAVIQYEKDSPPITSRLESDDSEGIPCSYADVGMVRTALRFTSEKFTELYAGARPNGYDHMIKN